MRGTLLLILQCRGSLTCLVCSQNIPRWKWKGSWCLYAFFDERELALAQTSANEATNAISRRRFIPSISAAKPRLMGLSLAGMMDGWLSCEMVDVVVVVVVFSYSENVLSMQL